MRVVEVNEIEQLEAHRDDWARLLAETPNASFFQTLEWLSVYWHHFGQDQRLRTLLVDDDDQLKGILPLAVTNVATRGGPLRRLGYPLDAWGTQYGPIGSNPQAVLTAGLSHVQKTIRDWDLLELDWTPGNLHDEVGRSFANIGVQPQVFSRDDISQIDLSQEWDTYWMGRHGKHRNNVRRAEKKLAEIGSVELLHWCSDGILKSNDNAEQHARWDLYDICEGVAGKSWQASAANGTTLTHGDVRPFLRDVHEVAVQRGAVSIYLLSVVGEPIAFSYNYVFGGTEYGLRMGYNLEFKSANPGTVLIHRILQDAFAREQLVFDLGEGDSSYKHSWRTNVLPSVRFCHYAKSSLRAQALRWKRHWWGASMKPVQGRSV